MAKRVCDFVNAHDDLIHIATFGEYRQVMRKITKVIQEARNVERKRRQTKRREKTEESRTRTQRAKTLIAPVKRGGMKMEEIVRRLETIFRRRKPRGNRENNNREDRGNDRRNGKKRRTN